MIQKMLDNITDDQRVREMQGTMKKSIDESRYVVTFSIATTSLIKYQGKEYLDKKKEV